MNGVVIRLGKWQLTCHMPVALKHGNGKSIITCVAIRVVDLGGERQPNITAE